ncbi:hypothetical protein EDD22DRAFT_842942 [Suillus occidentalis]|nr:hypothetical protein EDD22DRAFT_842942 [Suillus occidentalis]
MPRMRNDPNFNVCPDYMSEVFANTRAQLVNDNTTEAQASTITQEHMGSQQQCRQGYCGKHQVADEREEPKPAITPCSYALRKMDKGEYVELWYFTNDGLEEANRKKTDGSTAWVTAASSRDARAVLNDEDLPFEEFCQACPRMLTMMEETDWPEDRIRMMAKFWRNIQVHRFRSLRAAIGQKALLTYQAEQRKHWHVALKTSVGPYDLSLVNETVLEETRERVYWEEREKRDNARNYKVSFSAR